MLAASASEPAPPAAAAATTAAAAAAGGGNGGAVLAGEAVRLRLAGQPTGGAASCLTPYPSRSPLPYP